jgi:hypothetical protein
MKILCALQRTAASRNVTELFGQAGFVVSADPASREWVVRVHTEHAANGRASLFSNKRIPVEEREAGPVASL